jgi:hypothetical protein
VNVLLRYLMKTRLVQGLNSSRQKGKTSAKLTESSEPRETALWKSSVIYRFMTRMPTSLMEGNLSSGPGNPFSDCVRTSLVKWSG